MENDGSHRLSKRHSLVPSSRTCIAHGPLRLPFLMADSSDTFHMLVEEKKGKQYQAFKGEQAETSFHQRSPTSNRPDTFLTVQKSKAKSNT